MEEKFDAKKILNNSNFQGSRKLKVFDVVIDAENEILGRVAALTAKKALLGNWVAVVNCERALVSGNRSNIVANYLQLRKRNNVRFPSSSEQIMKRTIRGMINYKSGRGEKAFDQIRCYNNVPVELQNEKRVKIGNKNTDLMKLEEVGRMLKEGRTDG